MTDTDALDIEPAPRPSCPHCGSDKSYIVITQPDGESSFRVCERCGAFRGMIGGEE